MEHPTEHFGFVARRSVAHALTWWNTWFTLALLLASFICIHPAVYVQGLYAAWFATTPAFVVLALALIAGTPGVRGRGDNLGIGSVWCLALLALRC